MHCFLLDVAHRLIIALCWPTRSNTFFVVAPLVQVQQSGSAGTNRN
jgi:hypothetical protein